MSVNLFNLTDKLLDRIFFVVHQELAAHSEWLHLLYSLNQANNMALVIFKELSILRQEGVEHVKEHIGFQITFEDRLYVIWLDDQEVFGLFLNVSLESLEVSLVLIEICRGFFEKLLISSLDNSF
jgi:hypothetical protein